MKISRFGFFFISKITPLWTTRTSNLTFLFFGFFIFRNARRATESPPSLAVSPSSFLDSRTILVLKFTHYVANDWRERLYVFTLGIHNTFFSTNQPIIDIRLLQLVFSFLVLYTSNPLLFHTTILRFSASSSTHSSFSALPVVFENGLRCVRFFANPSNQRPGGDPGNSTLWKHDTISLGRYVALGSDDNSLSHFFDGMILLLVHAYVYVPCHFFAPFRFRSLTHFTLSLIYIKFFPRFKTVHRERTASALVAHDHYRLIEIKTINTFFCAYNKRLTDGFKDLFDDTHVS